MGLRSSADLQALSGRGVSGNEDGLLEDGAGNAVDLRITDVVLIVLMLLALLMGRPMF